MSIDLIARLVISVIAAINAAAAAFGFNPFNVDEQTVYTVVSFIAALITWVWGFGRTTILPTKRSRAARLCMT